MDADRSREPVNGLDVDRELQSLLAADPSPEFVARVRTRIAREPQPGASWVSWTLAAVAATAAIVVLTVALRSRDRSADGLRHTAPASAAQVTPANPPAARDLPVAPAPEPRVLPQERYVASASRRTGTATGPAEAGQHVRAANPGAVMPAEAEVLIDLREARAIRAFLDGARNVMDWATLVSSPPPQVMEAQPVQEIHIAPIEFQRLTAGNTDKGVPQ